MLPFLRRLTPLVFILVLSLGHASSISTFAGNGTKGSGGDDGPAKAATLNGPEGDPLACALNRPHGVFVDADGTLYLGDTETHRVRTMPPSQ